MPMENYADMDVEDLKKAEIVSVPVTLASILLELLENVFARSPLQSWLCPIVCILIGFRAFHSVAIPLWSTRHEKSLASHRDAFC